MLVFKLRLINFSTLLLLTVGISRDFENQLNFGVNAIPITSASTNLSSKLVKPTSSSLDPEAQPFIRDVGTHDHNEFLASPKEDPVASSSVELNYGLSQPHHEATASAHPRESDDLSAASLREQVEIDKEPRTGHTDVKMKSSPQSSAIAGQDKREADSQVDQSSSAKVSTSQHPLSSKGKKVQGTSTVSEYIPGSANLPASSKGKKVQESFHTKVKSNSFDTQNKQPSSSQLPNYFANQDPSYGNNAFQYYAPHAPNGGYASPYQIDATGPYHQTYADPSQQQNMELQLQAFSVLQPKMVLEPQIQFGYVAVNKSPTSSSANLNYFPGTYVDSHHVGGPQPTRTFQYSGHRRPQQKTSLAPPRTILKNTINSRPSKPSNLNRSDLKDENLWWKQLAQNHAAESSGTERDSSDSRVQPKQVTRLAKIDEKSSKESLTIPDQDRKMDHTVAAKTDATRIENSNTVYAEEKHDAPRNLHDVEAPPVPPLTPDPNNESISEELKRLLKVNENSPKASSTIPYQEGVIGHSVAPKPQVDKTTLEESKTVKAEEKHDTPKNLGDKKVPPVKPTAADPTNESFGDHLKEVDGQVSVPQSPNAPNGSGGNFPVKDGEKSFNQVAETKESEIDGPGDTKTHKDYKQALESETSQPSSPITPPPDSADEEFQPKDAFIFQTTANAVKRSRSRSDKEPSSKIKNKLKQNLLKKKPSEASENEMTSADKAEKKLKDPLFDQPNNNKYEMLNYLAELDGDKRDEEDGKNIHSHQDENRERELENTKKFTKKKSNSIKSDVSKRNPELHSQQPKTAYEIRRHQEIMLDKVKPYLHSATNIVQTVWDKKPNLNVGIPPLKHPSVSVKHILQNVWGNDLRVPLKTVFFHKPLEIVMSKLGRPPAIKTRESSQDKESETSTRPQIHPEEIKDNSFKEPLPSYVDDYLKEVNSKPTPEEIELTRVLGKFLGVESKKSLPPIHLPTSDPDYSSLVSFLKQQTKMEKPTGRPIKWLFEKIGQTEGRRRWKALIRQYEQPEILRRWEDEKKKSNSLTDSDINERSNSLKSSDIKILDRVLRLSEAWPTFYGSSKKDYAYFDPKRLRPLWKKVLINVLGKDEYDSRLKTLCIMSHRLYPHDWLPKSDLQEAYQQGLDTASIVLIGDLLQFGRGHFTLHGTGGVPNYYVTVEYLKAVWAQFPATTPWGSSPEKAWFLSQPERAKMYETRMDYLKNHLKYYHNFNVVLPVENAEVEGKSWWNMRDQIEWYEFHMDPKMMIRIGEKLPLPVARDERPLRKLRILLKKEKISKEMEEIIFDWFQANSYSPYSSTPFLQEELNPESYWSRQIEDTTSHLLSVWKQKTLFPNHIIDIIGPQRLN